MITNWDRDSFTSILHARETEALAVVSLTFSKKFSSSSPFRTISRLSLRNFCSRRTLGAATWWSPRKRWRPIVTCNCEDTLELESKVHDVRSRRPLFHRTSSLQRKQATQSFAFDVTNDVYVYSDWFEKSGRVVTVFFFLRFYAWLETHEFHAARELWRVWKLPASVSP